MDMNRKRCRCSVGRNVMFPLDPTLSQSGGLMNALLSMESCRIPFDSCPFRNLYKIFVESRFTQDLCSGFKIGLYMNESQEISNESLNNGVEVLFWICQMQLLDEKPSHNRCHHQGLDLWCPVQLRESQNGSRVTWPTASKIERHFWCFLCNHFFGVRIQIPEQRSDQSKHVLRRHSRRGAKHKISSSPWTSYLSSRDAESAKLDSTGRLACHPHRC